MIGAPAMRRLAVMLAAGAFLAGCASLDRLTPMGRYDLAQEAATLALEETAVQAERLFAAAEAGRIPLPEAERRYRRLADAAQALQAATVVARAAVERGEPPDTAAGQLRASTQALRALLASVGEDL